MQCVAAVEASTATATSTTTTAINVDEKKIRKKLAEERRKEAERQMLTSWLKRRLEVEAKNSRFNSFRVNQEYLAKARAAKSEQLRADLEVALPQFEANLGQVEFMNERVNNSILRTRADTRLPQSRAGLQGSYLSSLDYLGRSNEVKDRKNPIVAKALDDQRYPCPA